MERGPAQEMNQTAAQLSPDQSLPSRRISLDHVVMARAYASNAAFYPTINRVYARFCPENPPSRMEFDIEIEVVALAE